MSTLRSRKQSTLSHTHQPATNSIPSTRSVVPNSAATLSAEVIPERSLASLPFTSLLRSILLHTVSASPILLSLTTRLLNSNIDRLHIDNPLNPLGWVLYYTFYKHFCAGRNEKEIGAVVADLRDRGLAGVILSYAREAEKVEKITEAEEAKQVDLWLEGTKKTVDYTPKGDFVAVKYSGAGPKALRLLGASPPEKPNLELAKGLEEICELAVKRGVRLLVDAEQVAVQEGIDMWTVDLMRKYNHRRSDGKAVVYNTYQMYLKSAPEKLARHLALSKGEKWPLGVKLVRGAYLSSDPRDAICDTQADTDKQYDDAIQVLLAGQHGAKVDLVVATHNKESTRKAKLAAKAARLQENGAGVQEITYAQLMGMADELSFGLAKEKEGVKVYKYAVWGSVAECVKYLLRRAQENQSAAGRSQENVQACWGEVKRRVGLRRW
ncbi:FAD-linked oxidoreductase-like protein [Tirmania nivea]|nr:FAD-linked oxidoreductase-like protein [Tirmania nivea]